MTYEHNNADKNLTGLQNAMKYDGDGEPTLRVSIEEISAGASLTISGDVIVTDITGVVEINNDTGNPIPVSGTVAVSNFPTTQGEVSVSNFPTTQAVSGTVNIGTMPEVEIKNDSGNPVPVSGTVAVSGITGTVNVTTNPTQADAFGRQRVSNPITMFDSSHRYKDNGLWATSTVTGGSAAHSANEGLMNLTVTTAANAEVIRETLKVFSYQPGKSLLTMNSVVFSPAKPNLRQRVGYFGTQNGMYLELDGSSLSFVKRSYVTGSVVETRIDKADWNVDKMDGTGPSGITLDISKAQILWMDIEWLGLGTVRMGFVIDGIFVHCHSFHHANIVTTTYITTASLPLRYEIKNIGVTSGSSTMKQICSTVISEGGYDLRGEQYAAGTAITSPKVLTTAGTFYPIIAIRLKAANPDAVVIPTAVSFLGTGNGVSYNWKLLEGASVTTGSWTSAGADSSVEYTTIGTAVSGGRTLASGYINSANQGSPSLDIAKQAIFQFQLERNSFDNTMYAFVLAVTASTNAENVFGSLDWEEVTR